MEKIANYFGSNFSTLDNSKLPSDKLSYIN